MFAAAALSAAAAPANAATPIVLENEKLRAEIVPAWAGRLMFFGHKGGENVLWTQPEAADFGCHPDGTPMWKNVGGEKTWVGSQGPGWRAFAGISEGAAWPPPAWFDSMPLRVVRADPKSAVLRSDAHRGGDWSVAMEREFTLEEDCLVIRQRLIVEDFGANGTKALPDDDRRLWSVAQVPQPKLVMMRPCGEGRHTKFGPIGEPLPEVGSGWARIDLFGTEKPAKICADGDALAMPLADGGWFLIEQTAPQPFLDAIAEPGRAMVYASPNDFKPSAYAELEFAAYGPDAEQTLRMSLPSTLPAAR
jgi:hypothetical protein